MHAPEEIPWRVRLGRLSGAIVRLLGGPARRESPIVGNVDGIRGNHLCGWVLDRREPSRRLAVTVEGHPGGTVVAVADRYRADVQEAGMGDGYCGFAIPTTRLQAAVPLRVLAGSPPVSLPMPGAPSPCQQHLHRSGSFTLCLDNIDRRSGISGWARDSGQPAERQLLRLYDGAGRLLGEQRATHHRADLEHTSCDGLYGFAFPPVPATCEGPFRIEAGRGHVVPLPG